MSLIPLDMIMEGGVISYIMDKLKIRSRLILPQVNGATNPTLAFGDGDSGFYESVDDKIDISVAGSRSYALDATFLFSATGRAGLKNVLATATNPNVTPSIDDTDTGVGTAGADILSLIAGGVEGLRITEVAGAITHTLAGVVQGATFSNQLVNLTSSQILGLMTDPRFLNLLCENPAAGTMYDISTKGHDGTYAGTMTSGDRINKGSGWALDLDGTDDYINLGDSDDFSFGDGSNDSAFTIFGCIEVVASVNPQIILSKTDSTTGGELREYYLELSASEKIDMLLYDESANVVSYRLTNVALSVGWHTIVITYDGAGGATAANTITIYTDGEVAASTATNDASYVAMENLATPVWVGATEGTGGVATSFFQGDIAHIGIDAVEWGAIDAWRHYLLCRGLYNL